MDTPTLIWLGIAWATFVLAIAALRPIFPINNGANNGQDDIYHFLFDGTKLNTASASARELLKKAPGGENEYARLLSVFDDPKFLEQMQILKSNGTAFSGLAKTTDDQLLEVDARPIGGMVCVELKIAGTDAHKLISTQNELNDLRAECLMFREVTGNAPMFVARFDPHGDLIWSNDAFKKVFGADKAAVAKLKMTSSERICIEDADHKDHWFTLQKMESSEGEKTIFATPVDTLVSAEKSLANFVSTLTETFAHLTTGLAIFDSNGRLSLFNPALSDLTGVDPSRLIAQPSIRDFLELLRELRMVPEQRDFSAWRHTITRLELGSREGSYQEDWTLPSGRVFRVIGRPHPNGAVALIFEDISSTVTLERRYRDEIELGQSALDRISDAVAIFDTSGSLVFANNAFDDMWQIDSMSSLEAPDIAHMVSRWSEACLPTPIWDRLRSYVTSDESRTSWQSEVTSKSGRHLHGLFSPLPNGSTLTVFSRNIDDSSYLNLIEDESALLVANSTRDAMLAVVSEDFQQGAKPSEKAPNDTVNLLMSLSALPLSETTKGKQELTSELCQFAVTHDVSLEIGDWCWANDQRPPAPVSTLIWTFLLAAIETLQTDETRPTMRLSTSNSLNSFTLTACHDGLDEGTGGLSARYLSTLAERLSIGYSISFSPAKMTLQFTVSEHLAGQTFRQMRAS